jgi:hypothetical protein
MKQRLAQNQKSPCFGRGFLVRSYCQLVLEARQTPNVGRGRPFLALLDRKLDALTFIQVAEAVTLDGRVMYKNILPAVAS